MRHYYAIDLESWVYPDLPEFQNLTQEQRQKLDGGYIVDSVFRLLELLDKYKTYLTFFVIGELYEWYPDLIKEIKKAGHEIGYHTHSHILLKNGLLIKEQLKMSQNFLNEFKPKGFQAPVIYFPKEGYEILRRNGFSYSSSVYYGSIAKKEINGILEIPVSTWQFLPGNRKMSWPRPMNFSRMIQEIPFGSSYFTAIIGNLGTAGFLKAYEKMGKSAVLFIHNWQIFPPKRTTHPSLKFILRHPPYLPYIRNIKNTFEDLLKNFQFGKLEDYAKEK